MSRSFTTTSNSSRSSEESRLDYTGWCSNLNLSSFGWSNLSSFGSHWFVSGNRTDWNASIDKSVACLGQKWSSRAPKRRAPKSGSVLVFHFPLCPGFRRDGPREESSPRTRHTKKVKLYMLTHTKKKKKKNSKRAKRSIHPTPGYPPSPPWREAIYTKNTTCRPPIRARRAHSFCAARNTSAFQQSILGLPRSPSKISTTARCSM